MIDISKMSFKFLRLPTLLIGAGGFLLTGCAAAGGTKSNTAKTASSTVSKASALVPAKSFDLSHWKLTLPVDDDRDGKADSIRVIRGSNRKLANNGPLNNFALASHSKADEFAAIGGRMLATLHVDHVPLNANRPNDSSAYAGVIGQIHGVRLKQAGDGFGNGTEPLKIVYKKWPHHKTGSVYWHYERNHPSGHPDKKDIIYPVWGKNRTDNTDPGESGIALGENFSYIVNVYEDTMYLTFVSPRLGRVTQHLNLADNIDLYGKVDNKDHPNGYANDAHYFKAGIYNQCRAVLKNDKETETRCQGTGDWVTDKANGDYFQVSFSRLNVTQPVPQ